MDDSSMDQVQRVVGEHSAQLTEFSHILSQQQQTFSVLANQINSIDGRVASIGLQVTEVRRELDRNSLIKLEGKILELEDKITMMELDRAKSQGMVTVFNAIPKGLNWLVLAIGFALAYIIGKGKLPV